MRGWSWISWKRSDAKKPPLPTCCGCLRTKNSPGSARAIRRVTRRCCTARDQIKTKEIRRQDEALERAAITITEGGGGALYLVCSKLKRNGFERKIAHAFKEILADETEHKDAGGRSLDALIKTRAAYLRAARIITEVSSQRLRMRNEQFGFPLSEARMAALDQHTRLSAVKNI